MATPRARLVPTNYNSPIRLYSPQNVQEALGKQTQVLSNGALGIDFHNLAKPGNLAQSQVLKMVEEEDQYKSGRYAGGAVKRVAWPPPPEEVEPETPPPHPAPAHHQPSRPQVEGRVAEERRVRVQSPARPAPEPPKALVTLLKEAPVKQAPPPVFPSQPATTSVMGGVRSRGDQKWPPESVKQQAQEENAARIALAKGPACRPRKVQKDYSSFFAQHALNPTYPGYKAPPGTQHYIEEGTSNL